MLSRVSSGLIAYPSKYMILYAVFTVMLAHLWIICVDCRPCSCLTFPADGVLLHLLPPASFFFNPASFIASDKMNMSNVFHAQLVVCEWRLVSFTQFTLLFTPQYLSYLQHSSSLSDSDRLWFSLVFFSDCISLSFGVPQGYIPMRCVVLTQTDTQCSQPYSSHFLPAVVEVMQSSQCISCPGRV